MKKIIVIGPVLSRSGYGEMARHAVKSLMSRQDLFDVYVQQTSWGSNTNIVNHNNPDYDLVDGLIKKTANLAAANNNQLQVDVSIQVSLPTDWKKLAPVNIGYTAGIETNFISPAWLQPSMQMDKIIVISEHAKKAFLDTVFGDGNGNQYKVTTPIEVAHFPVKDNKEAEIQLDLDYDFNFLSVCQWGPRKNLEQTIVNFIQEFKNEEVGLVLKTNTVADSMIDKEMCEKRLTSILSNFPDRKCKVYLLHGYMSEEELATVYRHPKIKAIVSTTHGEGFGLPLFEATYNELPVVATDWSGHLDFLTMPNEQGKEKKMFAKIDFELKPIQKEYVWQGVLEAGTSWAFPLANSVKEKMREVYKDYPRFKSWAKKLSQYNKEKFTQEKVYDIFVNALDNKFGVENWPEEQKIVKYE
jgi:glycosyltransferase involved in cell wall biosynthesis